MKEDLLLAKEAPSRFFMLFLCFSISFVIMKYNSHESEGSLDTIGDRWEWKFWVRLTIDSEYIIMLARLRSTLLTLVDGVPSVH